MKMNKRRTLILVLLISVVFIPLTVIFTPKVAASWLKEGEVFSMTGFDDHNPSLAFDNQGFLHYTYTQIVIQGNDYEIGYNNHSTTSDQFNPSYFDFLSEGLGVGGYAGKALNTSSNGNSQIFIDNNTIHIVWQGINTSYHGGDTEIIYTNNDGVSLINGVTAITSTGANSIEPSIVVVDGSVFIAYYETGTGVRLKTNHDGNDLIINTLNPTGGTGSNGGKPKLSLWATEDFSEWRVDLVYIDNNDELVRTWIDESDVGIEADFVSRVTIINTGEVVDLAVDSNKDLTAICYVQDDGVNDYEIYVTNSSAFGTQTKVTNNADDEGDPDIILNNDTLITIFYVRNDSSGDSTIRSRDNYGTYFGNEDILIGKDQVPNSGSGLHIYSFTAESCQGEGTFLLYDADGNDGGGFDKYTLYINAYLNSYNDGSGDYNYYTWKEDFGDAFNRGGWLLEGIKLSFNTSMGDNLDLRLRLTDTVTNVTWENITTFSGIGGKDYIVRFYQPNDYFIARNPFLVEILNGSNNQDLIKIEIDPIVLSNMTDGVPTNYTSEENVNGTIFPYSIYMGQDWYAATLFFYDVFLGNGKENRELITRADAKADNDISDTFDSDNYVDLYKFYMTAGEQYNLSLTTVGALDDSCRLLIFNGTQQITDPSKALYDLTINSTNNGDYFTLYTEDDGNYYVVIENQDISDIYSYNFEYKVCPMLPKLTIVKNNKVEVNHFIDGTMEVNFEWDDNNDEFGDPGDLTIDHYIFSVYKENGDDAFSYQSEKIVDFNDKNINLTLIGGIAPDGYSLDDGIYSWNVTSVTDDGQHSKYASYPLYVDSHAPDAPEMEDGEYYYKDGQFTVRWSIPEDNPSDFSVKYYKLYRDRTSDFVPDDNENMISIGDTLEKNSSFEYGLTTETYYYKVKAVDQVGWVSAESDVGQYVVSIGGYVDPTGQEFNVLPGDYIEYELVNVIDGTNKDPNSLYANIKGRSFQVKTRLHFWLSQVSDEQIIPVRGWWYMKWMNKTARDLDEGYRLIGEGVDVFPFVTTSDTDYQKDIFDLFITRQGMNHTLFTHEEFKRIHYDWFKAYDVVIHSYYKEDINWDAEKISDMNFLYDAFIFVVHARTGILIEMTLYNVHDETGYSLKLVDTNIGLSDYAWWLVPLGIIFFLGVIAAIINLIVKKLEKRV